MHASGELIGSHVWEQAEGVAALRVQGNFMFDAATHRDFLGAILGTGIERSKVGDIILVGETGAQILVAEELLDHFELNLTQVPAPTHQQLLILRTWYRS